MSEETYVPVQLDLLRIGGSGLDALETMLAFGIVNAGRSLQCSNSGRFNGLAKQEALPHLAEKFRVAGVDGMGWGKEESRNAWLCAVVGARLLRVTGGSREHQAATWARYYRHGSPFFQVKSQWLWQAVYSARLEAGQEIPPEWMARRISWREFRILAALLSAPRNKLDFSFVGWEGIQARASGFHNKAGLQGWQFKPEHHCAPLTRSQIRTALERLEGLGFFAHVRYSKGKRGGLSAFSFRHSRPELLEAVKTWANNKASLRAEVAANRGEELGFFGVAK